MNQPSRHISVSSPGKLLISGEYAVLYGATAISLAVNRRTHCELMVHDKGNWKLRSSPPFWDELVSLEELCSRNTTDALTTTVQWFSRKYSLPKHVAVHMDTTGFFSDQRKLGLGSSAGVLVTLYAALATCVNHTMNTHDLFEIYRAAGNNGSGIDVLTSYCGGTIKFERQTVESVELPKGLYLDIYAVGYSTDTTTMVDRFRHEFDDIPVSLQRSFVSTACDVSASLSDVSKFFVALQRFIGVYRDLASAANLSVWSAQHETMYDLANQVGVLYKPSGAGGGDIGMAVATDPRCLTELRCEASNLSATPLDLQRDSNGVRVEQKS